MKKFVANLSGSSISIDADSFNQVGDFVSFYVDRKATALVRLNYSDSIVELPTTTQESKPATNKIT